MQSLQFVYIHSASIIAVWLLWM